MTFCGENFHQRKMPASGVERTSFFRSNPIPKPNFKVERHVNQISLPNEPNKSIQMEPNAPLKSFSPLIEDGKPEENFDITSETEAIRHATEQRLQNQTVQLKKFHEHICARVHEKERKQRVEIEKKNKIFELKRVKLLQSAGSSRSTKTDSSASSSIAINSAEKSIKRLLHEKKRAMRLLSAAGLAQELDRSLRADAYGRDILLVSTRLNRLEHKEILLEDAEEYKKSLLYTRNMELQPEHRADLYAAVRRKYMEVGRENAKKNRPHQYHQYPGNNNDAPKNHVQRQQEEPIDIKRGGFRSTLNEAAPRKKQAGVSGMSVDGFKTIDVTMGNEVKIRKRVLTSSTPWRKQQLSLSKSSTNNKNATTDSTTQHQQKYLDALEAQLMTPPLCSCGGANSTRSNHKGRTPLTTDYHGFTCANNCALYNQPKKKEKLFSSVYNQRKQKQNIAKASSFKTSGSTTPLREALSFT